MLKFVRFNKSRDYSGVCVWVIVYDNVRNREAEYLVDQNTVKIEKDQIVFRVNNTEYVASLF